ncbi:DUF58 domain-containing protein [Lichenihabitans sp. Uapishka_5]|uniref:DUF58 domain-containing protein n=1 Tax=Lichenihabitans sp. Uapishka_5 TaxID=3037302 RepID=UPI0029E8135A|nr:DUF58 domain-containing protein [Lichenihabitans sp. Uapishka_5]MDX7952719.1 DUF58 domain-containing protein [Lichenihabitans sp. Uapishka_5]
MASDARLLGPNERAIGVPHREAAQTLARRLPALTVTAQHIAASVAHGVHGRRRAGMGESFWQFRPFVSGESASNIDWRRSARDDRTYVREREWESAQTVWLWIDRSPSMGFQSTLAPQSKGDRALVLGLAMADLLVRGGERVGLHGLCRAMATRGVIDRFAEVLALADRQGAALDDLPHPEPLPARSRGVLIGDFLSEPERIAAALTRLAAAGAQGQLVLIADPMEDTFPFAGHVELRDSDSTARLRLGEASAMRTLYLDRLAAHRAAVTEAARAVGWTTMLHRTDASAAQALLTLAFGLAPASRTGAS